MLSHGNHSWPNVVLILYPVLLVDIVSIVHFEGKILVTDIQITRCFYATKVCDK